MTGDGPSRTPLAPGGVLEGAERAERTAAPESAPPPEATRAADGAPYWALSAEEALARLGSTAGGLSVAEARRRLAAVGPNRYREHERSGPARLLLSQFGSPLVLILLFAAVVALASRDWLDAVIILAIVLASAGLGFWQEYSAGNALARLQSRATLRATVVRDGRARSVPADEVVPGDVVELSAGSLVPGDGLVLAADDFFVNEAFLTGETFPAEKRPGVRAPADAGLAARGSSVLAGTSVRSGSARVLVAETGAKTEFGRVAESLALRPPETEFERGVRRFGDMLTRLMTLLVLLVFAANVLLHKPVMSSLLFAVALAVGIAPELLPAIITINLSKGAQAMARRGVIVRRLAAIEDFGSMDVLCTDKTGTLTVGVVRLDGALDPAGAPSDAVRRWAYLNASLQSGLINPLDEAITAAGTPADADRFAKTEEIPYDFLRKRLTVAVRDAAAGEHPGGGGRDTLVTKGALDGVLSVCAHVAAADDSVAPAPLDDRAREELSAKFAAWSEQGFRVLGVATREVEAREEYGVEDEAGMTFAGFLLFFDPPKPDAAPAIADLRRLGVSLKIITGDNRRVAEHVARAVGIDPSGVVTGAQMARLSDEALWRHADRASLFAEVDPNQKERIIAALRKTGHVVGYLGDGINDAPALHAADVGISVDTAADVARAAADFVLLERNLDVLRQGIEEGRSTFANTLKYIFTTTSANFGNMVSMAALSPFLPFLPLLPTQILLNNFLSDFPAMAIASDAVDPEQVQRPRRWDVAFIRRFMVVFGLVSSVFDALTFAVLLLVIRAGEEQFRTGWFVESLLTELVILLVVRTRRPLLRSRPGRALWVTSLLVGVVAVVLPYVPPVASLFGFVPLPPATLALLVLILVLYAAANEAAKAWFFRRYGA